MQRNMHTFSYSISYLIVVSELWEVQLLRGHTSERHRHLVPDLRCFVGQVKHPELMHLWRVNKGKGRGQGSNTPS